MPKGENTRKTGEKYEEAAAAFLEKQGYRIRRRNFRCRIGEIDLIADKDGYLIFIEVKYRRNGKNGSAAMAVSTAKQKKISRVADYYMMENGIYQDRKVRFDVVAIDGEELHLFEDAFPYMGSVRF